MLVSLCHVGMIGCFKVQVLFRIKHAKTVLKRNVPNKYLKVTLLESKVTQLSYPSYVKKLNYPRLDHISGRMAVTKKTDISNDGEDMGIHVQPQWVTKKYNGPTILGYVYSNLHPCFLLYYSPQMEN